jgi:serine protease Do
MLKRQLLVIVLILCASANARAGDANMPLDPNDPRVTPVVLAYRRAKPAVVNISTKAVIRTRGMFDEMFPSPFRRNVTVQNLGSGVIVHPDGYVVTNAHVIARAHSIKVTLADDTECTAEVLAAEPSRDLAILKISHPKRETFPHLPLGRSDDLMVGETVIAIGNPVGLANSLTRGIISATDRELTFPSGAKYKGLVQTDTPINPGNSGGPLLNIKGEFIGINTAIRGDAQNIGFAIPVDALAREFPDLLDYERLNRVVFGARLDQQRDKQTGRSQLIVTEVRKDTPADKAGLRKGDHLTRVDGNAVGQITDFIVTMIPRKPGDTLKLALRRHGKKFGAAVTLAQKPKPNANQLAREHFGMTLRRVTGKLAGDLDLPLESGLMVTSVDEGSPAEKVGLKLKDVIFQVGRMYVKSPADVGALLEDLKPGESVRIGVARGNVAAWVTLTARKKGR